ncbi:DnaJ domain-containing protein, partial [Acinetobacter baumannii]
MNTFINYYEILHVSQDAPVEIIRLAYKGLAQKYHPDRYQGNDANEKMQLINEALEVLTNENKRKDFDLKLNSFNQQKQKERDFQEYQKRKKYEDFQQ